MASDIANNGTFVVTNMKVDPGEQADAIQAQKLAQNTGFLFGRPLGYTGPFGTDGTARTSSANPFTLNSSRPCYFYRTAGHNKLDGTFRAAGTFTSPGAPDCYRSYGLTVRGNLSSYNLLAAGTLANIVADYTFGSTYQFTVDLGAYVSENTWGTLSGSFYGTSDDCAVSRTIQYNLEGPIIMQTYWG